MKVIGIDPGLTRCGIGVLSSTGSRRAELVEYGIVTSPASSGLHERLTLVASGIDEWIDAHSPDVVAVERVFAQHNVSTVMGTAQVAGLALVSAHRRGISVALHTPSEVKAAVTGSGRADKAQVQRMVAQILRLAGPPKPADAADALALALCALWRPAGTIGSMAALDLTPAQRQWAEAQHRSDHAPVENVDTSAMTPAQRKWAEARRRAARGE